MPDTHRSPLSINTTRPGEAAVGRARRARARRIHARRAILRLRLFARWCNPWCAVEAGRDRPFGYWRRRKLAVSLISLAHLPAIGWVAAGHQPLLSLILAIAMFSWILAVVRSHALRGWSVRLPAEVVADLLRACVPITTVTCFCASVLGLSLLGPLVVNTMALSLLCLQTLFLRGRPRSWVRIIGSPSNLGAAVGTFDQCMDLLGRDGCRFAPFRADRPQPEAWARRIRAWLNRGETVLVLEPRLRPIASQLQPLGDVIFAEDCLLFTPIVHPAGKTMDAVLAGFNRVLACIAALTLWPPALLLAILIKFDDGGPVFFTQDRVGKDGTVFQLYKFRTMRVDAPKYAVHPNGDDPRVTRIGRWMRKLSLDELPQIINVLLGDMRLVGPRPEMPFIVEKYDDTHRARLRVTPGITGLWQVSPHRNDPIHEHIEYDLAYIAHRGPILDLALIIATLGLANSSGN
ncbi:MAG: sugar transferase [Planctomycetes bacterium]|nr:sugar transferase [Planctomycetota bacterium]NOG56041.1 hypothetical protein [Planctomycetota bacterium]